MIVLPRHTGHRGMVGVDHSPHIVEMPNATTIKQNPLHAGIVAAKLQSHIAQLNHRQTVKH